MWPGVRTHPLPFGEVSRSSRTLKRLAGEGSRERLPVQVTGAAAAGCEWQAICLLGLLEDNWLHENVGHRAWGKPTLARPMLPASLLEC